MDLDRIKVARSESTLLYQGATISPFASDRKLSSDELVIVVRDLRKSYGDVVAVSRQRSGTKLWRFRTVVGFRIDGPTQQICNHALAFGIDRLRS